MAGPQNPASELFEFNGDDALWFLSRHQLNNWNGGSSTFAGPNQNPNNQQPASGSGGGNAATGKTGGTSKFGGGGGEDDDDDDKPVLHDYSINPADPNYVQGSAQRQQAYGEQAAGALQNIGQGAVSQGEAAATALVNQGQTAQSHLTTGGLQAQNELSVAGHQAQAGIQGATNTGVQGINAQASQGANELSLFSGQQGLAAQAAAARQGQAANFGAQDASLSGVTGFQNQLAGLEAVEGPSAAQAQLQAGLNAAQQSNLALARSGRGWGGSASALSQAAVQNAQAGQAASLASAQLRAQEIAAHRARQAANLGAAGQLGLSTAGQQFDQQQLGVNQFLQQQQANDALRLGLGQQQLGALQGAADTRLSGATAAGQLGVSGAAQGYETGIGAIGQGYDLGLRGMESGFGLGQAGLTAGADAILKGYGLGGSLYGQAGQMGMAGEQAANQLYLAEANQYRGAVQDDLTRYGIESGVAVQNAQMQNQMLGAGVSAAAALLPLLAASDRDAKTGIKPAETITLPAPSGGRGVLGPGGPAYDAAMGSAARAKKEQVRQGMYRFNPFVERDATPIEGHLATPKPGWIDALGAAGQRFGGSLMASDERSKTKIAELEGQVAAYKDQLGIGAGQMELGFDRGAGIWRAIGSRVGEAPPAYDPTGVERMARLGLDIEGKPLTGGFAPGLYDSLPSNADVASRVVRSGDRVVGAPEIFNRYQAQPDVAALDEAYRRQGGEPVIPSPRAAAEAIDAAPPFSYEYKQPERHGYGRFTGPMAGDLKRTPAGAATVFQGPPPDKFDHVDTSRLSLLNTAALHQMQERIDALESNKPIKKPPTAKFEDAVLRGPPADLSRDSVPLPYRGGPVQMTPAVGFNPFVVAPPTYDPAALDDAYARSLIAPRLY